MLPFLAVALCGQYAGAHAHHATCGHQTYNYGHQTYGHAQTYQHNTAFFAADPAHYASVVASYVKKQAEQAAAAQAQADLAAKVNQINDGLLKLTTQFSAALADPAPQQPYQAPPLASPQQPQYQAPPVPDKAPPQASPQQPYAAPPPPFATIPDKSAPGPQGFLPSFGGQPSATSLVSALAKCAGCHTGHGSSGGVKLFEAPGQLAALDLPALLEVADAVKTGRMPPRSPLQPAERSAVLAGVKQQVMSAASNLDR